MKTDSISEYGHKRYRNVLLSLEFERLIKHFIVRGEIDKVRYTIVDVRQRTNVARVYAAGDITNHPIKHIGTSLEAYGYIRRPYYYKG